MNMQPGMGMNVQPGMEMNVQPGMNMNSQNLQPVMVQPTVNVNTGVEMNAGKR